MGVSLSKQDFIGEEKVSVPLLKASRVVGSKCTFISPVYMSMSM